jgi:hypothetical protein
MEILDEKSDLIRCNIPQPVIRNYSGEPQDEKEVDSFLSRCQIERLVEASNTRHEKFTVKFSKKLWGHFGKAAVRRRADLAGVPHPEFATLRVTPRPPEGISDLVSRFPRLFQAGFRPAVIHDVESDPDGVLEEVD